jgi:regulator of sirC expression with transglutaminase-like and TPR domain
LTICGASGEGPHDIAVAALMLASLDFPGMPITTARAHLDEIAELARNEAPAMTNVRDGARQLSNLLAGRFGYDGDRLTYDDPRNANLMQVIARRRGMPVALGIIYIHAARAAGLSASGLDAPRAFSRPVREEPRGGVNRPVQWRRDAESRSDGRPAAHGPNGGDSFGPAP